MFYAHFVLAKKGPLARIWLAAHWDKKLTKAHVYETNIENSVDGIMQPKVKMALRTSGHLLLGVVRIYSRKAKYLLADCNEAFVKIKMAFRPGMVDLPEDKREAAMNAITLPDVFHDFDTAMPDLDDVDIDSQFTLNQTRAEEITMREDYGNITLNDADDGFGESVGQMEMEPEMLRDASMSQQDNFGSMANSELEYESQKEQRDISLPAEKDSNTLDAPINDDGFGGVGVQDFMSGGLFEGGSLFDDPVPGGNPSVRVPPSERTGIDEDDDFPQAPSPIHSDGSRPATPLMEDDLSIQGDQHMTPPPQLNETPIEPQPIQQEEPQNVAPAKMADTTTLLHNEDESFALAPVEASALKGQRRQRKRKLIVDETKAITGEGMKAQLSDSSDIVTTLDIAPPTKRLMHWKETGGVDELFSLPGRKLYAKNVLVDYQNNLKITSVDDEQFESLPGGSYHDDLQLENVGLGGNQEEEESGSPAKRGRKRKVSESPEKSAYLKRQEALAKQQEEFLEEERRRREEQLRSADASSSMTVDSWTPGAPDYNPTTAASQSFGQLGSPAYSGYGAPPSMGYPTPVHEPSYQQQQLATTPVHDNSYVPVPPAESSYANADGQSSFTEQWVNQVQSNPPSMLSPGSSAPMMSPPSNIPPPPHVNNSPSKASFQGNQADDDWADDHQDNFETDNYGNDDYDDEDDEADDDDAQVEGEEDMGEDETIEEFENRVLNKRAALLHRQLTKNFQNNFSQVLTRCNRKQVAQKFHSLLVLQKMMPLDLNQDENTPYAYIQLNKGPAWDGNNL